MLYFLWYTKIFLKPPPIDKLYIWNEPDEPCTLTNSDHSHQLCSSMKFFCLFHLIVLVLFHFSRASGRSVGRSVGPSLWLRLKYLNIYWMDWNKILYRLSWFPADKCQRLWWSPDFFPATMRLPFVVLRESSQRLLDGLPWNHPVPSSGKSFNLSNTLIQDQRLTDHQL